MPWDNELSGRRQSARAQAVLLMARITGASFDTICMVQDISPFGAKIRTGIKLPDGDLVTLSIAGTFEILAAVCWARDGYMGLSFGDRLDDGVLFNAVGQAKGRRMAQRFRRCADVTLATPRHVHTGRLVNLSTGGAAIELDGGRALSMGTPVIITIKRFLQRTARLQWVTETHAGLAFDSPLRLDKMEHCLIGWLTACQSCRIADCSAPSFQLSLTKREGEGEGAPIDSVPKLLSPRAALPGHLAACFAVGTSKSGHSGDVA